MKRKIISAVVYAASAYALAEFFDGLLGGEPFTGPVPKLIYLAIAGTVLFFLACILSLFSWRVGVFCGSAGGVLSWPCFAVSLPAIPWGSLFSILPYSNWSNLLMAILTLVVSTTYSLNQLRQLLRRDSNPQEHRMVLKLALALTYAAGVFVSTNWRGIWDWLFRLRYGT